MLEHKLRQVFFDRTTTIWLPTVIIFSAVAIAWAWFAPTSLSTPSVARSVKTNTLTSEIDQNQRRVEAELVTIRPTGFEPAEITRPEGPFILVVDNRSGLEEVKLQLDFETGRREREAVVHRKQLDWQDLVDLRPGRYVLKEVNHPDWSCLIIITRN